MLMFSEREREQGVELDLRSIKTALMAYADKEFYDWQADKNAPKVGAVLGPAIRPNPGKVAKQMAKAATKAAVAAAALSAGATTAAVIPMAPAMAHPSTLKLPPGDRRVKVLGILNPSNNPLNTLKRVSGRSHPSLDKSLIPKLQPTLIRDQPFVPVCASISSVSSVSSSSFCLVCCLVFIVYIVFLVYTTYLAYSVCPPYLTISRAY